MLVIREAQMEAFREALIREFHTDLLREANSQYPAWRPALDDAGKLEIIYHLAEQAQQFGAFGRKQIRRLVLAIIPYEPDYQAHAAAWAILTDPILMGSDKAEKLEALPAGEQA
jgi:hypothetical protein